MVVAFVVAACGSTLPPIPTSAPTQSEPPTTPIPSTGRFVPAAYPAKADAPCGQAKPPDASHAPYTGELKRITAKDQYTVVFELCRPDVAFLAKIAWPAFAINDSGWLRSNIKAAATGAQAIVTNVNGTGPYRLEDWRHGSEISLARNDAYWGVTPANERLIVRWTADGAARVTDLQNGTVDGIDGLDPSAFATVTDDVSLALMPRPGMNIFYIGFNDTIAPFDNEKVRQAIAIGIDRQHIVDTDLPPGTELATAYAPCALPHGCAGSAWSGYDPVLAKETLSAAGYPNGFDTTIQYPEGAQPFLPDPARVAAEIQSQLLANLGIRATLVPVPDPTLVSDADARKLDGIHLFGQSATYPDVSAFLDPSFGGGAASEFGKPFADIGTALATGDSTADDAKREAAYARANNAIRTHVPMIPIARTDTATAFRVDVDSAAVSPLGLERFAAMTPGDRRQLVWMTTAEPPGLYCADETDPIADLVCAQMLDGLYAYDGGSGAPVPALATTCDPNPGLTVWTCKLRHGVLFDDGSSLDANDVVMSFAVQWDAEHPLHKGRTGTFQTFADWFGGFLDPPPVPPGG
jgi:ABC-type transport system substrate-binding protein